MKREPSLRDHREFIRGVTVASIGSAVALHAAQAAAQPRSGGAIVHAREGQLIPKRHQHIRQSGADPYGDVSLNTVAGSRSGDRWDD